MRRTAAALAALAAATVLLSGCAELFRLDPGDPGAGQPVGKPVPVAMKQTFNDDADGHRIALTVVAARCTGTPNLAGGPAAKLGQWCLVTVDVANLDTEVRWVIEEHQLVWAKTAQDAAAVDYKPTAHASRHANGGREVWAQRLEPGAAAQRRVLAFDIPPDQQLVAVELHAHGSSQGMLVAVK